MQGLLSKTGLEGQRHKINSMQLCNYRKYVLYELQICVASILDCYEASQWKKEVSRLKINCVEAYLGGTPELLDLSLCPDFVQKVSSESYLVITYSVAAL